MDIINEMDIKLPSYSVNEGFARSLISAFICPLDPTIEELTDIKTAVSEAVTNCIVHAYPESIGPIYINSKLYNNGLISIKIRDKGCGMEDVNRAMEPLYTTSSSEERAGLGFAVMQSFMDKIKVTSKVDHGTTVVMSKRIIRRFSKNG